MLKACIHKEENGTDHCFFSIFFVILSIIYSQFQPLCLMKPPLLGAFQLSQISVKCQIFATENIIKSKNNIALALLLFHSRTTCQFPLDFSLSFHYQDEKVHLSLSFLSILHSHFALQSTIGQLLIAFYLMYLNSVRTIQYIFFFAYW